LAAWASALNDAGYWAWILDAAWRIVFVTDELRLLWPDVEESPTGPIGSHYFSANASRHRAAAVGGYMARRDGRRERFLDLGGYVLSGTAGGRHELRQSVDPELADLVDELEPDEVPPAWLLFGEFTIAGSNVGSSSVWCRINDSDGNFAGCCQFVKPAAGMSQLAMAAATADLAHLERLRTVETPGRRAAAILMADVESSSPLARRLSTAQYFAFGRRLVRAIDQTVIGASGIVGRHTGDGVVAFFVADATSSESAAARSCITVARSLRDTLADIAIRSEIPASEVSLRFGLHWGATLYMGRILTTGRSEVTALGDEVNEAARIEACATGSRILASKSLVERLDQADATALGLDTGHTSYTLLADLATATDKARRDAPSIAVCEL
jgi:class 3 adenylate cyclase